MITSQPSEIISDICTPRQGIDDPLATDEPNSLAPAPHLSSSSRAGTLSLARPSRRKKRRKDTLLGSVASNGTDNPISSSMSAIEVLGTSQGRSLQDGSWFGLRALLVDASIHIEDDRNMRLRKHVFGVSLIPMVIGEGLMAIFGFFVPQIENGTAIGTLAAAGLFLSIGSHLYVRITQNCNNFLLGVVYYLLSVRIFLIGCFAAQTLSMEAITNSGVTIMLYIIGKISTRYFVIMFVTMLVMFFFAVADYSDQGIGSFLGAPMLDYARLITGSIAFINYGILLIVGAAMHAYSFGAEDLRGFLGLRMAQSLLDLISSYDMQTSTEVLVLYREDMTAEMYHQFQRMVNNLQRYKEYLPSALFMMIGQDTDAAATDLAAERPQASSGGNDGDIPMLAVAAPDGMPSDPANPTSRSRRRSSKRHSSSDHHSKAGGSSNTKEQLQQAPLVHSTSESTSHAQAAILQFPFEGSRKKVNGPVGPAFHNELPQHPLVPPSSRPPPAASSNPFVAPVVHPRPNGSLTKVSPSRSTETPLSSFNTSYPIHSNLRMNGKHSFDEDRLNGGAAASSSTNHHHHHHSPADSHRLNPQQHRISTSSFEFCYRKATVVRLVFDLTARVGGVDEVTAFRELLEAVVDLANEGEGEIEEATPSFILVSFGARFTLVGHEQIAVDFAVNIHQAVQTILSSYHIAIVSGSLRVGAFVAGLQGWLVVGGPMTDLAAKLNSLQRQICSSIVLTSQTVSRCKQQCCPVELCRPADRNDVLTVFELCLTTLPADTVTDMGLALGELQNNGKSAFAVHLLEKHEETLFHAQRLLRIVSELPENAPYRKEEVPWIACMDEKLVFIETGAVDHARSATSLVSDMYGPDASSSSSHRHRFGGVDAAILSSQWGGEAPQQSSHHTSEGGKTETEDDPSLQGNWEVSPQIVAVGRTTKVRSAVGNQGVIVAAIALQGATIDILQSLCNHSKRVSHGSVAVFFGLVNEPKNNNSTQTATTTATNNNNGVTATGALAGEPVMVLTTFFPHGSLKQMVLDYGPLKPQPALLYLTDVLKGLEELHDSNMIHGCLRPSCVMMDEDGTCLVTRYGIWPPDALCDDHAWSMAPELLQRDRHLEKKKERKTSSGSQENVCRLPSLVGQLSNSHNPDGGDDEDDDRSHCDPSVDVWSFGLLACHLLGCAHPIKGSPVLKGRDKDSSDSYRAVLFGPPPPKEDAAAAAEDNTSSPSLMRHRTLVLTQEQLHDAIEGVVEGVHRSFVGIIHSCLQLNPAQRPTVSQLQVSLKLLRFDDSREVSSA